MYYDIVEAYCKGDYKTAGVVLKALLKTAYERAKGPLRFAEIGDVNVGPCNDKVCIEVDVVGTNGSMPMLYKEEVEALMDVLEEVCISLGQMPAFDCSIEGTKEGKLKLRASTEPNACCLKR